MFTHWHPNSIKLVSYDLLEDKRTPTFISLQRLRVDQNIVQPNWVRDMKVRVKHTEFPNSPQTER
jgi:hypothetical protein